MGLAQVPRHRETRLSRVPICGRARHRETRETCRLSLETGGLPRRFFPTEYEAASLSRGSLCVKVASRIRVPIVCLKRTQPSLPLRLGVSKKPPLRTLGKSGTTEEPSSRSSFPNVSFQILKGASLAIHLGVPRTPGPAEVVVQGLEDEHRVTVDRERLQKPHNRTLGGRCEWGHTRCIWEKTPCFFGETRVFASRLVSRRETHETQRTPGVCVCKRTAARRVVVAVEVARERFERERLRPEDTHGRVCFVLNK